MPTTPCPSCGRTRAAGHYLCAVCWFRLSAEARTQLNRRGDGAIGRLKQLLDQIHANTPLGDIRIE